MARDAEDPNIDDELELDTLVDADEPEGDEPEGEDEDTEDEDGEEEVLTFGDDAAEEKPDDSSLIKHLRDELKRARKEAAEARTTVKAEPIVVGEKPTLAAVDYDEEKYEAELDAWKQRKDAAERSATETTDAQERENEAWAGELKRYNDGKATLGYADVDDAEATVTAALNTIQQAVMVKAANNPSKVMYALGKHPDRLTQLASISDPLKFAAEIARLEGQLKVIKKRKTPEPEQIERGGGGIVRGTDKHLAKLEKKADETGDRTELVAYKRKLKKAKS